MASSIRAGRAFVELFAKDNITKELDRISGKLKSFGAGLAKAGAATGAAGAAITAPLLLAATQFASMGDELTKASDRTGVAVEALAKLKYAAEQSGASFDDLQAGVSKMQKAITLAAGGSAKASQALAAVGLSAAALKDLSPDEQFKLIADRLSQISDPGKKATAAMAIFGKGAVSLIPLINGGAAGLDQLSARFDALGLSISKSDTDAATKFGDTLADLKKQFQQIVFQVGAAIAGALQPFAETLTSAMATVIKFVKANRGMAVGVLALGAGLIAGGALLSSFGLAVAGVGAAIGLIMPVISAIGAVMAAIVSPIGLVTVAVAGAAAYLLFFTQTGQDCVAFLKKKFNELKATATETFGGISDALAAGDILLAAQVLWVGLKLAFVQGTQVLQNTWFAFKAGFIQAAADAFYGALTLYENVKAALKTAFEDTTAYLAKVFIDATSFLGSLWDGFTGSFASAWDNAVGLVSKGLNIIKGLFDSTFDSDAANKSIDEVIDKNEQLRRAAEVGAEAQREQQSKDAKAGIDKDRDANKSQITGDKNKALDSISDQNAAVNKDANDQADKSIADLEAQKKDLQAKLDGLTKKSGKEREAQERGEADDENNKPPGPKKPNIDDLNNAVGGGKDKVVTAAGVFSAANASTLVQGNTTLTKDEIAEKQLDHAEKQTELLQKLVDQGADDDRDDDDGLG